MSNTTPRQVKRHDGSRLRRNGLYAAVIAAITVVTGFKGILPVYRVHLRDYLSIGDGGFGLLLGIGSLTGMVGLLFGGWLLDRLGPRRILRFCLTGIAATMFLLAFAGPRFRVFLLAMALSGLFSAPFAIAVSAYLAKLFPYHRRRILSLNLASTSLGGMMFPLLAESLLGWSRRSARVTFGHILHLPFLLSGALVFGASLLYRKTKRPTPGRHRGATRQCWQWRDLVLPPRAFGLAVLIALHGLADYTLFAWMPRFLGSESFQTQPVTPGLVMSGYALAYLGARGFLAVLPEWLGKRAFLVWPGIIGGGILFAGLLSRNYMFAVGGYLLGALCWSCEYPAMVGALLHHDSRRFGATMAVSGLMSGLLIFLVMNGFGWAVERIGDSRMWTIMLLPALVFVLVGTGGLLWSRRFDA